jgi:hypothetical protein
MAPYVIILPSALIDIIDLEELRYVLGQALGHICFGHTRMAVLIGGEGRLCRRYCRGLPRYVT